MCFSYLVVEVVCGIRVRILGSDILSRRNWVFFVANVVRVLDFKITPAMAVSIVANRDDALPADVGSRLRFDAGPVSRRISNVARRASNSTTTRKRSRIRRIEHEGATP